MVPEESWLGDDLGHCFGIHRAPDLQVDLDLALFLVRRGRVWAVDLSCRKFAQRSSTRSDSESRISMAAEAVFASSTIRKLTAGPNED